TAGQGLVAKQRIAGQESPARQQPLAPAAKRQPASNRRQPQAHRLEEMAHQLARRRHPPQIAGQDRREQLMGHFGKVDHAGKVLKVNGGGVESTILAEAPSPPCGTGPSWPGLPTPASAAAAFASESL